MRRLSNAFVAYCECEEVRSPLLSMALQLRRTFNVKLWPDEDATKLLLQLVRALRCFVWHRLVQPLLACRTELRRSCFLS